MTMMATEKDAAPDNTTLQMVRAEINGREFQRWMGSRRLQDPDHAMHCLLKECFGELAPKPFRLIMHLDGTTGVLYGYGWAVRRRCERRRTFAPSLCKRGLFLQRRSTAR